MNVDYVFLAWGVMLIIAALIQMFFTDDVIEINKRIVPKRALEIISRFVPFGPDVVRAISVVELVLGVVSLVLAFW